MKLEKLLQEKDSSVKVIPWRKGMGFLCASSPLCVLQ